MRNHHYHSVYTGESDVSPLWIMIFRFIYVARTTGTLGVMKIYQLNETTVRPTRNKTTTASRLANNHRDRPKVRYRPLPTTPVSETA